MRSVLLILFVLLSWGCSNSLSSAPQEEVRSTNLLYELPDDSHVKLWLENAYSTKVKTIVDTYQEAGNYSVTLTMTDKERKTLPYGIYTYHIETNAYSVSRPIVYVKSEAQGR